MLSRIFKANTSNGFEFAQSFKPLPATRLSTPVQEALDELIDQQAPHQLLAPIFQTSPYLLSCAQRHQQALADIVEYGPEAVVAHLIEQVRGVWAECATLEDLSKYLRQAKHQMSLALGIAELGGIWTTKQVVHQLSLFADACVHSALNGVIAQQTDKPRDKDAPPAARSGLFVLAMGKHGGFELNYSSDIDIIFFYDAPKTTAFLQKEDVVRHLTRLVRDFSTLMQDHTEHGYVFRVDLRLRPDPSSTPSALSTDAALHYYQTRGRTWERTAYTKARAIAGDFEIADAFMAELNPFIWRKYLDFAALEQIHALKKQLHRARGLGEIVAAGHDVKRGRGSIREIEFFVQSQLLIAGGRDAELRLSSTEKGLEKLSAKGWVEPDLAHKLIDHYWFLRAIENRVQMVADAQTHQVPEAEEARRDIATMMGFENLESFDARLEHVLNDVSIAYDGIFAQNETEEENAISDLNFHGTEPAANVLDHLSKVGFSNPPHAYQILHRLIEDDLPALQADQARQTLDQLLPNLLEAMGETGQADRALINFDRFTRSLPMGVQLFALLAANDGLLKLIIDILGTAPRLAELVGRRPHILDSLLEPQFLTSMPDYESLKTRVDDFISQAQSFEDGLDRARVIGQEFQFLISVRLLANTITPAQASSAFSELAEIITSHILALVKTDIETQFGHIPEAQWTILAMGRLGSQEMSATSDLDLILLYEHPDAVQASNGDRSLDPPAYFARATQRLIAGLTAPTAEGTLYEADMRLRPSGRAGPLATRFKAFQTYQRNEAWTWEHQALTRARVVAGDAGLKDQIHLEIEALLTQSRDPESVKKDVAQMRERLLRDRPAKFHWHIKLARGGLVEIEFIAQAYALIHAQKHPQILTRHTRQIIKALQTKELIAKQKGDVLIEAYDFYAQILQLLAISHEGTLEPDAFSAGLKVQLATHAQMPDFDFVDAELVRLQAEVADLFDTLIGVPTIKD